MKKGTAARNQAVAIREVDVHQVLARRPERRGDVGFLDAHVKKVAHQPQAGAVDLVTDRDTLGEILGEPRLIAIERFEEERRARLQLMKDQLKTNTLTAWWQTFEAAATRPVSARKPVS